MHRADRRAWAQERRLERRLEAFERHEDAVIHQLKADGFLVRPWQLAPRTRRSHA